MGVAASLRVDVGLGGSFRAAVLALAPIAYWPFSEPAGSTVAEDLSGNGHDAAYVGNPNLGALGAMPEGGSAMGVTSSSDYATVTMDLSGYTASFSVLAVVKPNAIGAFQHVWGAVTGAGAESRLQIKDTGVVNGAWRVSGSSFNFQGSTVLVANTWYVLVITMNGATDEAKLYVAGVLETTMAGLTGTLQLGSGAMRFAQLPSGASPFDGDISHVAFFDYALTQAHVTALQTAANWTNITADTVADAGLSLTYGFAGSGPRDVVASAGELGLTLRNDAGNSGSQQGYYSPNHASKRSGWDFGIPIRLTFTASGTEYVKFRGRLTEIEPDAGQYRRQHVRITAHDYIRTLVETDAREVTLATDETDDALINALINALPFAAQPAGIAVDTGLDTIPVAFDNLGSDVSWLTAALDVVESAQARLFVTGNGTLTYRNRLTQAAQASAGTFSNTMHGLSVPTTLDLVYNHVRITVNPRVLGTSTIVLFSITGTPQAIPPQGSIELWGSYRDPADPSILIGGYDVITPAATTDYLANSASNGSGSNLTGSVTVTIEAFGSAVKFTITNAAAQTAYLVDGSGNPFLQVRGKAVYDLSPQTAESFSAQTYGKRTLAIDLLLQDDVNVAQGLADYLLAQRVNLGDQVEAIEFIANDSSALMTQALAREPGDRITITEPVTGVTAVDGYIQSVTFTITPACWIQARWTLAPAVAVSMFILDDAVNGVLDTSPLGYA